MANVLSSDRQRAVLRLLVEGNSIRSAERITDVHRDTICRLVVRFGAACKAFMDDELHGLELGHVEVDEIWTFVGKKQSRLTVDERAETSSLGDMYLWTCVDQGTKLVPAYLVGKRSADNARRLMRDLASRVNMPAPHESDDHAFVEGQYAAALQLSTDGFPGYREAVDLAFGPYVRYGQLIKQYRNATMDYTPSEMIGTDRRPIRGIDDVYSICTSHVERHNLTIRTFMKRFTRLSLGFSKKLENLEAACAMFLAYYNWCWRPRFPGKSGRYRVTPAMAAKVTSRLWTLDDLYDAAM